MSSCRFSRGGALPGIGDHLCGGHAANFVTIAQFNAFQNQVTNALNQINQNINQQNQNINQQNLNINQQNLNINQQIQNINQ